MSNDTQNNDAGAAQRYFIDCEFDGHGGPLLSLAIVSADGNGIHIQTTARATQPWVIENVVSVMESHAAPFRVLSEPNEVGSHVRNFLARSTSPTIIADSPVDIGRFCAAISTGSDGQWKSADYPRMTFEVHNVDCYPTTLAGAVQHNAWWDAMALREKLTMLAAPLSPSPEARASVAEDAAPAIDPNFRCAVTDNLCGTDSWSSGFECPCASCQAWLRKYRGENWSAEDAAPSTAGEIERLRAALWKIMKSDFPETVSSHLEECRALKRIASVALAAPPPADVKGGEVAQIRRAFTYIIGHTGHLPGANAELLAGLLKRCAGYANHGVALVDALASDDTVTALRQALKRQEDALWNILNRQTRDGVATVSERDLREGIRLIRDALRAPSPTEGTPTASDVIGTKPYDMQTYGPYSPVVGVDVQSREMYMRYEDMSCDGQLHIFIEDDGDVIVQVSPSTESNKPPASVQFCTSGSGGGQSPLVRSALIEVARAIVKSNEDKPQNRE